MAGRRARAKNLSRAAGTRQERRTIVVFCEGSVSEPAYLTASKQLPGVREAIAVTIEPRRGLPLQLVERAIERSKDDEVDECWCVFDVEAPQPHPNLEAAVRLAERSGIRLAVSNPCFELWLILHHQDHTAYVTSGDAEKLSRGLDGRPGKGLDPDVYLDNRASAAKRAAALDERHERNQTPFPRNNPSSTMHGLLAALEPPE